ncbi:MAG TPA: hypothetical protein VIM56_16900 [Rhizomicrobium sp.]
MLLLAFYLITAAILLGTLIALSYLGLIRWRWWPGVVHGALGATGLGVLVFSLGGPPRGAEFGVQSFGAIAAYIGAAGLLIGLAIAALNLFAKTRVAWLVGAHVTVAITAYLFLMAYVVF